MTVSPATCNHTFYQNTTWEFFLRICVEAKDTSYSPTTGLFSTKAAHGHVADDPVVLTKSDPRIALPEGFEENTVYYVVAAGLTTTSFALAATIGGSAIAPSGTLPIALLSSVPLNLTGLTVDSDIKSNITGLQVATFNHTVMNTAEGHIRFYLSASTTADLPCGTYSYDVSLTDPSSERDYYLRGTIDNQKTISRN